MKFRHYLAAACAVAAIGGAANAAVIPSLTGVTPGPGGTFTFTYQGTLSGDAGLNSVQPSRLVIFDFAGYVPGSIFVPSANLTGTTELVTTGMTTVPGTVDDPTIPNLVFSWNDGPFQTSGGPFPPIDFNGIGARSIFGGLGADTFAAITVRNNPDGVPGGTGTPIFDQGFITVPAAIPEPATWGMLIMGFGMIGAGMRLRRRGPLSATSA
jgi:hypothetical protein